MLFYNWFPLCFAVCSMNTWGWANPGGRFCFASTSIASQFPCKKNEKSSYSSGLSTLKMSTNNKLSPVPSNRISLKDRGGVISRLTFDWVKEVMKLGNKKTLEVQDLWKLNNEDLMSNSSEKFQTILTQEYKLYETKMKSKNFVVNNNRNILQIFWDSPITKAVSKMYSRPLINSGLLKVVNTIIQFSPALIISKLLKAVEASSTTKSISSFSTRFTPTNILLLLTLFTMLCMKSIIENQYFDIVSNAGANIRGVISTAIFRKSMKLSPESRQNTTTGEIVNYMQLDTTRMEQVASSIHILWDGLFQVIGYTTLLVRFLGPSAFAGVAVLLLLIPLNAVFLKRMSGLRAEMLKHTDNRVKLTNEILLGIRAIKSYNWELPFSKQLSDLRIAELIALQASASTRAAIISVLSAAPSVVAVLTLGVYATLGNVLTPAKVFTSLALFNQLRFPLVFYPLILNTLAEGKISLFRLDNFLRAEEVKDYITRGDYPPVGSAVPVIDIQEATFSWGSDPTVTTNIATNATTDPPPTTPPPATTSTTATSSQQRGTLSNINLKISRGELVAVIGAVGSGKSTLLASLLGELTKRSGDVTVNGHTSYVPQSAWIPNESLRNVVLFGKPFDWKKYREVLRVCGLERDLELLEAGDQTEIGERGVNLSGGQKQRVSIARAVYDNSDIYLFDDPLSALDSEVGTKLFQECIKKHLRNKTRILVTHQLAVLPEVDRIVLMGRNEDGSCQIVDQGTYTELISRGHDIALIAKEYEITKQREEVRKETSPVNTVAPVQAIVPPVDSLGKDSLTTNDGTDAEGQEVEEVFQSVVLNQSILKESFSSLPITSSVYIADPLLPSELKKGVDSSRSGSSSSSANSNSLVNSILQHLNPILPSLGTSSTPATTTTNTEEEALPPWTEMMEVSSSASMTGNPAEEGQQIAMINAEVEGLCVGAVPPSGGVVDSCFGPECPVMNEEDNTRAAVRVPASEILSEEQFRQMQGTSSSGSSSNMSGQEVGAGTGDAVLAGGISTATTSPADPNSITGTLSDEEDLNMAEMDAKLPVRLMTKEERGEGAVGLDIYASYLKAANKPVVAVMVVMSIIMASGSQVLQQWVVAAWTSDPGYVKRSLNVYLSGVAFMAGCVAFFNFMRTYLCCLVGKFASESIHQNLVKRVLRAPLSFFESTPVGRLVQRFSKDLDQIDQQLPSALGQALTSFIQIATAMCAIIVVTPSFALVMLPLLVVYYSVTNFYRNVARELKRLDAVSRSPIFAHFGESLGGLSVIRCFKKQQMFCKANEEKLDDNISAYFALKAVDRWLSVRLESVANLVVLAAATLILLSGSKAGAAGVSLTNALSITSLLNWAVRNAVDTEALMNSVERVAYTTNKTPVEKPAVMPSNGDPQDLITIIRNSSAHSQSLKVVDIPLIDTALETNQNLLQLPDVELVKSGWPWKGGLTLHDVGIRYRDDFEPVLRGVNAEIYPGESVGIVGRTGSGKSSLFRALLRLTELESGFISIDGVNISQIGLDVLRSSISIIPQDPVLFSGTIRNNLDPTGIHSDELLWDSLTKSHLADTIRGLPGGLGFNVSEGGDNLSAGQKQLLCLTRALVRRSKLLLLDEATSSVDSTTDRLIQKTIRQEFGGQGCTVLTIAHRLKTILDADKIIVMDSGRVAELDSPTNLLQNQQSIFAKLVAAERKSVENNNSESNDQILKESKSSTVDVSQARSMTQP